VIGMDSSFEVGLRRMKKSTLVFHRGKTVLGEVPCEAVTVSLWQETVRFVDAHRGRFDRRDGTSAAIFDDLFQAMREFETVAVR
jgi:hypothetical protein